MSFGVQPVNGNIDHVFCRACDCGSIQNALIISSVVYASNHKLLVTGVWFRGLKKNRCHGFEYHVHCKYGSWRKKCEKNFYVSLDRLLKVREMIVVDIMNDGSL